MISICQRIYSKDKVGQKRKEDRGKLPLNQNASHTFYFSFPLPHQPHSTFKVGIDLQIMLRRSRSMYIAHCSLHNAHCTMSCACNLHVVSLCAKLPSWHLVGCQVKWGCIKATNLHSIGIAQSTLLLLLCKNGSSSATCCAKMANIVARRWGQVGCRGAGFRASRWN